MNWEELENACKGCDKCPLCKTKTNTVFGVGNKNTDIMFVGEAPGEQGAEAVGCGHDAEGDRRTASA